MKKMFSIRKKYVLLFLLLVICAVVLHSPASMDRDASGQPPTVPVSGTDDAIPVDTDPLPVDIDASPVDIDPIPVDTDVLSNDPADNPPFYTALTFDDGPHPGTTDRLLDGLRDRGVHATFFLIGEEAAAHPELVLRMRDEGHQIGNHTWGHQRLEDLSENEILEQIGKTDAFLHSLLGDGSYWLRPPYGLIRAGTESLVQTPMIKWSVDPRDWESRDTSQIVQAVLENVEPGSMILLHDIYPTSVDAALELVDILRTQGYELVTVEELFRLNGVTPQPGVIYRYAA